MRGIRISHRTAAAAALVVALPVLSTVSSSTADAAGTTTATTAARAAAPRACSRPAKAFVPDRADIPAIGRTVKVIQVKRTSSGAVGAGPVTEGGKWLMAMDNKNKPGSRKGSVILSGHTWPDGSALGNAMLRDLNKGDGIVLTNQYGRRACYKIHTRAQYAVKDVPNNKAFRYWGPEQVTIVTCSGKRLGPGNWSHRTIWYATPYVPSSTPPPSPEPEEPDNNGGLLGGLLGIIS